MKFSIVIVVTNGHTHAALLTAILVYSGACQKPDLFEGSIALVSVVEIWGRVVGNKDINQTVIIEVTRNDTQPVETVIVRHACLLTDVGECAIAVVPVKRVAGAFQTPWTTLYRD